MSFTLFFFKKTLDCDNLKADEGVPKKEAVEFVEIK